MSLPILFALTLASNREVLYGNNAFLTSLFSTKKRYSSSFSKKFFVFQKVCFKVKLIKIFKISGDFHLKNAWYRFLKNLYFLFTLESTSSNFSVKKLLKFYRLFSVYLMNHSVEASVLCSFWQWDEENLNDCVNMCERSEAAKLLFQ